MTFQGPVVVLAAYRPKPGAAEKLDAFFAEHVPSLQRIGLATSRPPLHLRAEGGICVEMFEWVSEEVSRSAHDHPEVQRLWAIAAEVCDFIPLDTLPETKKPFSHFTAFSPGV